MSNPRFATAEDADRGFEFQVHDDSGEPIDWFITVVGVDSKAYKQIERAQSTRNMKMMRTGGVPQQELEKQHHERIVGATVAWRGKDAISEFSPETAAEIYKKFGSIREQVQRQIEYRANFLPKSAKD